MKFSIVLFAFTYILVNFFIGKRILNSLKNITKTKSNIFSKLYWAFFILLSSSFCIYMYASTLIHPILSKFFFIIGSYYEVALLYLIIFFPIAFLLTKLFRNANHKIDFYIISLVLTLIILPISSFLGTSSSITNYDILLDKPLTNGDVRIALLSDIHLGDLIGNNRLNKLVSEVNNLHADVVIIAGDLIDSDLDPVIEDDMLSKLSDINSKFGVYFAFGNHDLYTYKSQELTTILQDNNVNVLRDQSILVDNSFYIVGRNDIVATRLNQERKPLNELLLPIDTSKPIIVVDHNPNDMYESKNNDIDLQLSGHTHNGQLFPLNIMAKSVFSLIYGHEKLNDTNVIVSSGYGTWGPRMRTGSRSEIVFITLKSS